MRAYALKKPALNFAHDTIDEPQVIGRVGQRPGPSDRRVLLRAHGTGSDRSCPGSSPVGVDVDGAVVLGRRLGDAGGDASLEPSRRARDRHSDRHGLVALDLRPEHDAVGKRVTARDAEWNTGLGHRRTIRRAKISPRGSDETHPVRDDRGSDRRSRRRCARWRGGPRTSATRPSGSPTTS